MLYIDKRLMYDMRDIFIIYFNKFESNKPSLILSTNSKDKDFK
jgi:hypothetical protein